MAVNFLNNTSARWPWAFGLISSVAGLVAASLALRAHYGASTSFCEVGASFSCDAVNQSVYSQIMGIPWSLIGILGFVSVIIALFVYAYRPSEQLAAAILGMSIIALGIQGYLTYIEAFVLNLWCLLCLLSQTSVVILFISSLILLKRTKKEDNVE